MRGAFLTRKIRKFNSSWGHMLKEQIKMYTHLFRVYGPVFVEPAYYLTIVQNVDAATRDTIKFFQIESKSEEVEATLLGSFEQILGEERDDYAFRTWVDILIKEDKSR